MTLAQKSHSNDYTNAESKRYRLTLKEEEKNSFVRKRNHASIEDFRASVGNVSFSNDYSDNELIPDYNPIVRGRVKYTYLRKSDHLQHVITKLVVRNVIIPLLSRNKIRELICLLKIHEGDENSFLPVTLAANFGV